MKVMVALPTDQVHLGDEFVSAEAIAEMGARLEALGIDGCFVTDHPAPDDRWLAAGGHHALEPTVALAFVAASTSTLRIVTNIYVAAYRNPLLAAKTLATLDVLSGGRLTIGVGAGYLRPEFAAVGADFEHRNDRLDEALDAMKLAWTGETVARRGEGWESRGATLLPRPTQRPHPPIWCGGNSSRAMRRAVERGDGWMPFATAGGLGKAVRTAEITSVDVLGQRLDGLDALCEQHGRTLRPTVCFTPPSSPADGERFIEDMGASEQLGVDWLSVTLPCQSRAQWCDAASELAGKLRAATPN